jgi:integrase
MATFRLGSLMKVTLQHSWQKGNSPTIYFRRKIPKALQGVVRTTAIPGATITSDFVIVCLNTTDVKIAAQRIAALKAQTDREWAEMKKPGRAGEIAQAKALLAEYGIDPAETNHHRESLWALQDEIDETLPAHVREDATIDHTEIDRYLSPIHRAAHQMVTGRLKVLASDALEHYVKGRWEPGSKPERGVRLVFRYLTDFLGDRDIRDYRKTDVTKFVQRLLDGGHNEQGKRIATTTVDRYLGILQAAFGEAITEYELDIKNVFEKAKIPQLGKDAEERESFNLNQYRHLYRAIDVWTAANGNDQLRLILTLVAGTGARLAEVVGLASADVHLSGATPYVDIQPHPWRSLKNPGSAREVPLTGRALEAAQAALELSMGSRFLFPAYTSEGRNKSGAVSAALLKWIRGREGLEASKVGNHSLRHGMADLLRAADCPDSAKDQILGHATPGIGAKYGQGYPLDQLAGWLGKATAVVGS